MTEPKVAFVVSYLADYRVGFYDALERELGDRLAIFHPELPLDSSVRVTTHARSRTTRPVRKIFGVFESQRHLVRDVRSWQPDVVIAEANTRDLTYLRLLAWCRLHRIPVAIWGLGRYNRKRSPLETCVGAAMNFALLTASDRAIAKGKGPAEYFRSLTLRKSKVSIAPNSSGLEETLILRPLEDAPEARRGEAIRLLYVGRITEAKDLQFLLRGLSLVAKNHPWHLNLVGDGPYEPELRCLVDELSVSERVTFHGSRIGDELIAHYLNAHMLVLPGKGGLVVPEALAAGVPLLVGPLDHAGDGTLSELLSADNAVISTSSEPSGFRDAFTYISRSPGALPQMRINARRAYRKHGGMDAMARVFLDFITDATQTGSRDWAA